MDYNWNQNGLNCYLSYSELKEIKFSLNTYQIYALKQIIDIFSNSNTSWEYSLNNRKNHNLRIIINNLNNIRWGKIKTLNSNVLNLFLTHICFDVDNFNSITIQTFKKAINKTLENNLSIDKIINDINNLIYNEIIYIINQIQNCSYIQNYFFEQVKLEIGDFVGFYDFGKVKIDCGQELSLYDQPKILKFQIQYNKLILPDFKYPITCIETIEIDRKIILTLIQFFLRCYFNYDIRNGKYYNFENNLQLNMYQLDTSHSGKLIHINRNQIISDYCKEIPDDTKDLLDKYYSIDYELQEIFLNSCEAYLEAQKSDYGKAITFYTIAIENLANNHYKQYYNNQNINKKKRIYNLITDIFNKEIVSQDFINYFYSIRCLYSHEGIANNRIKQEIFEVEDSDNILELNMEQLTYSVLIKWLIYQNKEKY